MKKASTRKRTLVKRLKVNGNLIEATTIKGFADIVGKSKDSIARYEELGYIPSAPLIVGTYRYYPVTLCNRLRPLIQQFPPNKPPHAELIIQINQTFSEERNRLCQNQK